MNLMTFTVTCLWCPLQIEGHVGEIPFYFRARHGHWRVSSSPLGTIYAEGEGDDFTVGQAVDMVISSIEGAP